MFAPAADPKVMVRGDVPPIADDASLEAAVAPVSCVVAATWVDAWDWPLELSVPLCVCAASCVTALTLPATAVASETSAGATVAPVALPPSVAEAPFVGAPSPVEGGGSVGTGSSINGGAVLPTFVASWVEDAEAAALCCVGAVWTIDCDCPPALPEPT